MSQENLLRKKSNLLDEIKKLSKECDYINKLRTAVSDIDDVKLKNNYSKMLDHEISVVKPKLADLKLQIIEVINIQKELNMPEDFNLFKILKSLDWIKV
jgi:uncharacterized protein YjgD (DUF1641 family)